MKQKVIIISELRRTIGLNLLLKVSGIARSTFYYHSHPARAHDKYESIKSSIQSIFCRHRGRYGYRRVRAELIRGGVTISQKTVLRLMQEMEIKCTKKPKKYKSYRGAEQETAPDSLKRNFDAKSPDTKWVTDVTEFRVADKKLYLSPIIDLFNREVVSFSLSERPLFGMVRSMLESAFERLENRSGLILHSDQGWQYRMPDYKDILRKHSVTISMSRKGNCYDNAVAESFFGTLKSEMFHGEIFTSIEQLKTSIMEYIDYYNNDRIKMDLKAMSPVGYRLSHQSS